MTLYVGLDLGQLQDYSARAVLRVDPAAPTPDPPGVRTFFPSNGGPPERLLATGGRSATVGAEAPHLHLIGLHRWKLKTKYSAIVGDMAAFLAAHRADDPQLVIDHTGVGVAVVEQFDAAHIPYTAVSIHGGQATTHEGRLWRVPKAALVAAIQVPMQNRRLTVEPPGMPYASELRAEMANFRHTISAAAHESYAAWRESDHDDLVLALALACWQATRPRPTLDFW